MAAEKALAIAAAVSAARDELAAKHSAELRSVESEWSGKHAAAVAEGEAAAKSALGEAAANGSELEAMHTEWRTKQSEWTTKHTTAVAEGQRAAVAAAATARDEAAAKHGAELQAWRQRWKAKVLAQSPSGGVSRVHKSFRGLSHGRPC